MKKLKLQIEKLRVEPFETQSDIRAARGTVRGHLSELGCYSDDGDATCYCGVGQSAPHRICAEMPGTAYQFLSDCC